MDDDLRLAAISAFGLGLLALAVLAAVGVHSLIGDRRNDQSSWWRFGPIRWAVIALPFIFIFWFGPNATDTVDETFFDKVVKCSGSIPADAYEPFR